MTIHPKSGALPPAGTSPYRDDSGLVDVSDILSAFSGLYETATNVTAHVAADLQIGNTDVRAIAFIGANPGATPKAIAQHLGLSTGAITSLVDRITAAEYTRRVSHPTDRRSVVLELAPTGQQALDEIVRFYSRAFREAVDPTYIEFIASVMRAVTASLEYTATLDLAAR